MTVLSFVKPDRLYIVSDGPRIEKGVEEKLLVDDSRLAATEVSWNCETVEMFYDCNVGGPRAGFEGISWFFGHEEQGIVLEDDNVPAVSFFEFCDELLELYKHNCHVGCITGNNFQQERIGDHSYYFSKYNHVWGWASWRRSWNGCTLTPTDWRRFKKTEEWNDWLCDKVERRYWERIFNALASGKKVHWDYAWTLHLFKSRRLTATPNANLVTNIGFDIWAQNAKNSDSPLANIPINNKFLIASHPEQVIMHTSADRYVFDHIFGGKWMRFPYSWLRLPRRAGGFLYRWLKRSFS